MMKLNAIQIAHGKLVAAHINPPAPGAGEVLINVAYAGINRADVFQVEGKYPLPEETQMIPGLEVSGEVAAVGAGVTNVKVGDKVAALMAGGAYAEVALADANQLFRLDGSELKQAAALPEALVTNWLALKEKAQLEKGETVLIHAGASGIGTIGIQMAKFFGARVIATAGSDEKCKICADLGAEIINYHKEFVSKRVLEMTNDKGVDVIIDVLGGKAIPDNLKCLADEGRLVSLAFLDGAKTDGSMGMILTKRLSWYGMMVRTLPKAKKDAIFVKIQQEVWPAVLSGAIAPVIDTVFSLKEAEKAHVRMRDRLHIGKILLEVR